MCLEAGSESAQASDASRERIADADNVSDEKIAAWQVAVDKMKAEATTDGGVKSTIDIGLGPEQVERVDKLSAAYRMEQFYKDLQQLRSEFTRAQATYDKIQQQPDGSNPDIDTGVADIALINIYQRFIDPGVSVREGDVELLQRAN